MGFWIFMLIMDLLIPLTMIGFGKYFLKTAPKEINAILGYRITMSMKNKDTWIFAHNYCGRIWYSCGWVMLLVSIIGMVLIIGRTKDTVGNVGAILCGIQMIPLIGLSYRKSTQKNF